VVERLQSEGIDVSYIEGGIVGVEGAGGVVGQK